MRKIAFAAAFTAFAGMTGVASAADLGSLKDAPEYTYSPAKLWTGLYIGGHIGGVRGDVDVTDTYEYAGDPTKTTNIGENGLIGGIQIGYNRQSGKIVYGLEADLGKMDISGNQSAKLFDLTTHKNRCGHTVVDQYDLNSNYEISSGLYGDIALRVGFTPTQNSLLYLKGGPAFLKMDYDSHYAGGYGAVNNTAKRNFDFNHSDTMWGWTVGAGVEYALSPKLSLKAEYQHFDFGSVSYHDNKNISGSELDTKAEISPTADAVTIGLNYNLSGGNNGLK